MNDDIRATVKLLTEHSKEIIAGSYKNVDRIFSLTDISGNSPEIAELAETFGMMSVKVEAREFSLEQTVKELREKNAHVESLIRQRAQLSSIFISTVLLTTVYIFILGFFETDYITRLPNASNIREYVSRGIELVTLAVVISMIKGSTLPLKNFGLTLKGWKRSVAESLTVSAVAIALLMIIKVLANRYSPGIFKETQVVNFGYFGFSYVTYLIVAPMQEFISRGTVQGTLSRLFVGPYNNFVAIMVTSFLFGALHMCHSIHLSIAALFSSWLWGWMFQRQKTLVGVGLSHFLVGNAAGLMGYWTFFSK
ncbi:MAG: type II CAAX endopeptidase family protein [Candidatus Ozemobacteraceae bacterium]